MASRRLLVLSTIFLIVVLLCTTNSVSLSNVKPEIASDQRLERTISRDQTGVALEDLLRSLSAETLLFSCAKECASLKLQLHLQNRSLLEIMNALAELVPGSWQVREDGKGYILNMHPQSVQYRRRWWDLFLEARRQAQEPIIQALIAAMHGSPKPTPEGEKPQDDDPAFVTEADRYRFFNSLPPDLIQTIAQSIDDTASYSNEGLVSIDDEGSLLKSVSDLPQEAQAILRKYNTNLPEDSYVRFTNDGRGVEADFIDAQGEYIVSTMVIAPQNAAVTNIIGLNQSGLDRLAQSNQLKNAPLSWRHLADYQAKTFWKNALPEQKVPRRIPPPRRADVLRDIAASAQIDFIADYYSQPGVPSPPKTMPQPLERPLEEELNLRAAEYDMSWKKQGNLYLFRDNRWYRDDLLEVPSSLARQWLSQWEKEQVRLKGADIPESVRTKEDLERKSALVSKLTRWQLTNGLRWLARDEGRDITREGDHPEAEGQTAPVSVFDFYPFYQLASQANREYHLLRFYASLPPEAQVALCEQRLPLASLTVAQRQQALWLSPILRIAVESNPPAQSGTNILLYQLRWKRHYLEILGHQWKSVRPRTSSVIVESVSHRAT